MYLSKSAALGALLIVLVANPANAGVVIYTVVDNRTLSEVSLNASSTEGAFVSGPQSSVAAGTRMTAATTWTFGFQEQGHVVYGPCEIGWDVSFIGYYVLNTYAFGPGCRATLTSEYQSGAYGDFVIELDIT